MLPTLLLALSGAAALPPVLAHPVELRVSPLVELWLEVRALSEEEGLPEDAALAEAVTAMRALAEALGPRAGFGVVEGNLVGVEDAATLVEVFGELPETSRLRGGAEIALRAPCVAAATAVAALEPRWRAEHWPARLETLRSHETRLARALDAHGEAIYSRLRETLGLRAPDAPIPVHLVGRAPWPGAFTHRRRGGGAACFVAVEEDLSDLLEALVHETIHALDLATPGPESLLVELRAALDEAGVSPKDAHDWVHTLFFLEAAACVRATADAEHVDYGDRTTLYERSRPMVDAERPLWTAWTASELEREDLVAAIVGAASGR